MTATSNIIKDAVGSAAVGIAVIAGSVLVRSALRKDTKTVTPAIKAAAPVPQRPLSKLERANARLARYNLFIGFTPSTAFLFSIVVCLSVIVFALAAELDSDFIRVAIIAASASLPLATYCRVKNIGWAFRSKRGVSK